MSMDNSPPFNSFLSKSLHHYEQDEVEEGEKESTGLLSNNATTTTTNARSSMGKERRNVNRSMVHSVYESPKVVLPQSLRRQSSVPASPIVRNEGHSTGTLPSYLNNIPDLWNTPSEQNPRPDHAEDDEGRHPSASLMIEDASPPLPWKEAAHDFAPGDIGLRSEASPIHPARFSIDSLAGGAFAMPSSHAANSLSESTFREQQEPTSASTASPAETKRRRWQSPRAAKALESSIHSTIASTGSDTASVAHSPTLFDSPIGLSSPVSEKEFSIDSNDGETSSGGRHKGKARDGREQPTKTNTFGLRSLSSSGIVSGLTSLKNSIMIPALLTNTPKPNSGRVSPSLSSSQSSLLEFVEDQRGDSPSMSSSMTASPSMFRSAFIQRSNGQQSNKESGVSSVIQDDHYSDSGQPPLRLRDKLSNIKAHEVGQSPKSRRSTFGQVPNSSLTGRRHRTRTVSQNTAARSLSALELEFQQLVQRQSQLSAKKISICKELQGLYNERNQAEVQQEKAASAEDFEQADTVTKSLQIIQGRIQRQEKELLQMDKSLLETKKKQDELGRSVSTMHQAVLQEMVQMKQAREQELAEFEQTAKKAQESQMDKILADREQLEKTKSDLVLEQDFLGKNEAELCERMEEETKVEQEELDELMEKRKATRAEILALTKKLEHLNQEDKEFSSNIERVQQKIRSITQQFDTQVQQVSHERHNLDRQLSESTQRAERLERLESDVQKHVQETALTQTEISTEIRNIESQQARLEGVRQQFSQELDVIQQLRREEETFKEREAGWSLQTSNLQEKLRKHEAKIRELVTAREVDQQFLVEKELDIDALEKRIHQLESSKVLAVRSRDFKKAAASSSDIAFAKENLIQKRDELKVLQAKSADGGAKDPAQDELLALQAKYDDQKKQVKEDEAKLLKDVETVAKDTLHRLEQMLNEKPDSKEKEGAPENDEKDNNLSSKSEANSGNQLSRLLLKEMKAEIEGVWSVARVRFGREVDTLNRNGSSTTKNGKNDSEVTAALTLPAVDPVRRRDVLERDIEAAVAEEDYDTAASLQQQLDELGLS
ncbi:hypothetical protein MVEG_04975 [Podila verticillata NRRL 6337]|nr:hypothetical protein MVEG_04975 [Podila verticillata NRRL 6337]